MNKCHNVEVLGVELRQFAEGELKAIVPRVIGQTTAAQKAKITRAQGRQWDEPSFIDKLRERCGSEYVGGATAVMDWARSLGLRETWGKGGEIMVLSSRFMIFAYRGFACAICALDRWQTRVLFLLSQGPPSI